MKSLLTRGVEEWQVLERFRNCVFPFADPIRIALFKNVEPPFPIMKFIRSIIQEGAL